MKFFLCFFLFFISANCFSQKSYWVTYIRQDQYAFAPGGQPLKNPDITYNLVFNDSISFTFFAKKGDDGEWQKYCKKGASAVKHHSAFYNRSTNYVYHGVSSRDPGNPYFIYDTLPIKPVHIDSTIKIFKGWRCREAYAVRSPGDTIFALLAIDYPFPFGPMNSVYFPYLQLELYHTKTNYHILATKITEGDYKIFMPRRIPIITREEHYNRANRYY